MKTTKVELTVYEIKRLIDSMAVRTDPDMMHKFRQALEQLEPDRETNYQKYLNTNAGKTLLKEHTLNELGVWEIRGEDPNCDFGGHHHEPVLATVEGVLKDIIAHGTNLPRFWQWGAGGSFRKITIEKL